MNLDRHRPSFTVEHVHVDELLRAQNWGRLTAQLTMFAWKRTRRRSWELARDLAHDAIADVIERGSNGWNPEKEPLLKYLCRSVIGLSLNDWRRKRNTSEISVSDDESDAVALDRPSPEERSIERQWTSALTRRLEQRLSNDEVATIVLASMLEGLDLPRDQASSTGLPIEDIRRARRRLFDAAETIARELGGLPKMHAKEQVPS